MVIVYIFVYYLAIVLSFTGIPSIMDIVQNRFGIITPTGLNFPPDEINCIPFYWLADDIRPYIENMLLFVPFVFMLPLIWKKYKVLWKTALSGLAFSLIIELSQLFNSRITDLDEEAWFYLAGAFAGMFLVFYPFLRPLLHPYLKYFIF